MSRIDFTPEQTTTIGVSASTSRSADTSKVSAAPRWTPPRPPVANTRIPPAAAIAAVAATVVAPSRRSAYAGARSRRDSLTSSVLQTRSSSSPVRPILGSPSRTAIVAGTAPAARMDPSSPAGTRCSGGFSSTAPGASRGRPRLQGTVDVGVGGADVAADVEGRALVRVERAPVVEVQSGDRFEQRDVGEEGRQQGRALCRGQRRALALLPLQPAPHRGNGTVAGPPGQPVEQRRHPAEQPVGAGSGRGGGHVLDRHRADEAGGRSEEHTS